MSEQTKIEKEELIANSEKVILESNKITDQELINKMLKSKDIDKIAKEGMNETSSHFWDWDALRKLYKKEKESDLRKDGRKKFVLLCKEINSLKDIEALTELHLYQKLTCLDRYGFPNAKGDSEASLKRKELFKKSSKLLEKFRTKFNLSF